MEITQPHWEAEYTSCDQLAEGYDGVSRELYKRLWEVIADLKETVPPENCGSWHEYNECNGTLVSDHWEFFTEDERAEINEVFGINSRASAIAEHGDQF